PPRTRCAACRRRGRSCPPRVRRPSQSLRAVRGGRRTRSRSREETACGDYSGGRPAKILVMSDDGSLRGVSVLVAGAGLAGLAAARDLLTRGAEVTVVDARDRVGGRVLTVREGFAERQHAEIGGDMIDQAQEEI